MSERWEYKIVRPSVKGIGGIMGATADKLNAHFEHELNELGRMGWNCYHVDSLTFYLKRKI